MDNNRPVPRSVLVWETVEACSSGAHYFQLSTPTISLDTRASADAAHGYGLGPDDSEAMASVDLDGPAAREVVLPAAYLHGRAVGGVWDLLVLRAILRCPAPLRLPVMRLR